MFMPAVKLAPRHYHYHAKFITCNFETTQVHILQYVAHTRSRQKEDANMSFLSSWLLILCICSTYIFRAQSCSYTFGKCPALSELTIVDPLNASAYLGDWYAQRQTPTQWNPIDQVYKEKKCGTRIPNSTYLLMNQLNFCHLELREGPLRTEE